MDNYNVNRKVANFKDFSGETEKEELQKVRRSTKPNSEDQQHIGNSRFKFNKVTHKMDDLSPDMIDDKIDAIEELEESSSWENAEKRASKITHKLDPRIIAHNIKHNIDDFSEEEILSYFIYFMKGVNESFINESKSSDFLEWLGELKEEIEGESVGSGSAWNHGRDELISQVYKKAKKMLK